MDGGQSGRQWPEDDARAADFFESGGDGRDAEAGGDEPHFDLHVLRVLRDVGFGAGFDARGDEGVVEAVLLVGMDHDEAFAIEILPFEARFFGEAMAFGDGEDKRGLLDEAAFEFRRAGRRAEQAGVQFTGAQTAELLDAGECGEGKLDAGIFLVEAPEDFGEQGPGGGRDDAEAQGADEAVLGLADELLGMGGGAEDAAGFAEKNLAGGGEVDGAGGAVEKAHAEFLLEILNLRAESGLRDAQALGGAAEIQFLRHGDEIA